MKRPRFIALMMQAQARCAAAWHLWLAQGGARRCGAPSRLVLAAEERALAHDAHAELFRRLDGLFPLGLTWMRRTRT